VKLEKIKLNLKPEEGLFSSGLYKYLILEIFLNIVHMPPLGLKNIEPTVEIAQRNPSLPTGKILLDNILTSFLIFLRSYHLLKLIALNSSYNQYESERICLECNSPLNFLFLIKAEFKNRPFSLVGLVMLVSIFVFGYSVRSIEMFFMYGALDPTKVLDWRYYWNGFWCVIITMSTVGFGDFYPVSILGRAIIVIACFWGTFLISLMVAALTVNIEFNSQEAISYDTIKSVKAELEYGKIGTVLIQSAYRYRKHMKQLQENNHLMFDGKFRYTRSYLFNKLRQVIVNFRNLKKEKVEKIEKLYIEYCVDKLDQNLTVGMDKILSKLSIVEEIKILLDLYESRQNEIKKLTIDFYKEIEEVSIFKENFLEK